MTLFLTTFLSILKLFLIAAVGYLVFKNRYFNRYYRILLFYTVDFALVILIFNRFVYGLDLRLLASSKFLLLIGFGIIICGFLLGHLVLKIFNIAKNKTSLFLAVMAFANSGYLPLPLVESIFQGQEMITAQIYIFFITIPLTLCIWSIGVPLVLNEKLTLKKIKFRLTAPFVAVIVSMVLALLNIKMVIPISVKKGLDLISLTVTPAIMLMLGGAFSNFNLSKVRFNKDVFVTILFKLLIYPALALPFILMTRFNFVLKTVLLIETAVPPAVNLAIINKRYCTAQSKDNLSYLLGNLVFTYIFCILSLPIVLTLLQTLSKNN